MRVIVRFSLDGDDGTLTVALGNILSRYGIARTAATATYEGNIQAGVLASAMEEFWDCAAQHQGATIDHFWMYSDNPANN